MWVSNRGFSAGSNTICTLPMHRHTGVLSAATTCVSSGGTFPRGMALAPGDPRYLIVGGQDSANVATFLVGANGQLEVVRNLTGLVTPVTFA